LPVDFFKNNHKLVCQGTESLRVAPLEMLKPITVPHKSVPSLALARASIHKKTRQLTPNAASVHQWNAAPKKEKGRKLRGDGGITTESGCEIIP
jgi:hypothetical protein